MLSRPGWAGAVLASLLIVGAGQVTAYGDGGKVVCNDKGWCRVIADDTQTMPGKGRDNGKGASDDGSSTKKPRCYDDLVGPHSPVPCHLDGFGDWINGRNCYFQRADPQPSAGDPRWEGHSPEEGAVYDAYCPDSDQNLTSAWLAQPPNGGAAVDPEVLAREAVKKMRLLGPDIASPRLAGKYTVGVPMWMWVNQSATTYGPQSASASAGGVTVTATAKVSQIVWQMGDGSSVTCNGPGTPYTSSEGMTQSPTCGHVYSNTSAGAQNGKFPVTATSTWTIDWEVTAGGGGQTGQLTQTQQSQMQVAVGEVQVVR